METRKPPRAGSGLGRGGVVFVGGRVYRGGYGYREVAMDQVGTTVGRRRWKIRGVNGRGVGIHLNGVLEASRCAGTVIRGTRG